MVIQNKIIYIVVSKNSVIVANVQSVALQVNFIEK